LELLILTGCQRWDIRPIDCKDPRYSIGPVHGLRLV
jgi:hypothetical protein